MALCPFATYKPISTNHGAAMAEHIGLVLHVQQGDGSLYGFFDNPASEVSAHFWCGQDGALEQYLDTAVTAWAEVAGNASYLSVETEGFDTAPLTPPQVDTVGHLLAWAAGLYSFPLIGPVAHGQPGFTPHCNPDGTPDPAWGDHPCPGTIRLGQMPAILAAAQSPTPPSKEYEIMDSVALADGTIVSHAVTPGGHYLEITRSAGKQGQPANDGLSIIDITAEYPQFAVAP
jgi:N-acetylmuramoyl-L-alanine amidase-like protein